MERKTIEILTERFRLLELSEKHVTESYLRWFEDNQTNRFISYARKSQNLEDLKDYVMNRVNQPDIVFLGIFDKNSNHHIGNIKYEPVNSQEGYAIMGILIGERDYRGKGVAGEVLTASAAWLKSYRSINQILLGVSRSNTGAIRTYEKTGFVIEESIFLKLQSPDSLLMVWHI